MAICNVFKELTKSNGTFFTFSQYAEDLTKHQSNNSYKVIPSRFICCDVDYSLFTNKTLPNLLQNNFENGCSFLRDKLLENWTPEISKNLFWNEIGEKLLLSNGENSIVYCGDINIQSYSEQDNIGYNEIYCYIPNDAKKMEFNFESKSTLNTSLEYDKDFICGYNSNDLGFTGLLDIEHVYPFHDSLGLKDYKYRYDDKYNIDLNPDDNLNSGTNTNNDSFKFNTVVVFYDISNGDVKYENIPLGMFVTGTIYEGKMGGEITKYVNNGDIYYSGTSYGLRICNRFVVSPNSTELQDTTVNSEEDGDYPALAQVMSAMTDSQSKMDEVINSIHKYQDGIKTHLAQFKDSRVNIPYIRYINEVPYWFVNGKNTDVPVWGGIEALQTNVDELNKTVKTNTTNISDLQITVGEIVDGVIKFENIGEYNYKAGEQVKSIILKSHLLPGTYSIQEIGRVVLSGSLYGGHMGLSLILRDYNISDDNGVNDVVIDVINAEKDRQFTSTRPFTLEICPVESEFLKTYYGSDDKESLKNNLQAGLTGFTITYPGITIQKITEKFTERDL
jgi:hypothetical protein